jgi:hypothetical protein
MSGDERRPIRRLFRYVTSALLGVMLYVLSSGPMLGLAFWLRERTGIDQFYAVMWLYYPLFKFRPVWEVVEKYVEWWVVDVFRTVGPG